MSKKSGSDNGKTTLTVVAKGKVAPEIKKRIEPEKILPELTSKEALNEAQIYNWLADNSGFLLRHESLLADLDLPDQSGVAISLHQRQLHILRASNEQLEGKLMRLVENAKSAESINQRLFELAILLIEDRQTNKPNSFLTERIRAHFDLSCVRIINKYHASQTNNPSFIHLLNWLGDARADCIKRTDVNWAAEVFGDVATQINSIAVVAIYDRDDPKLQQANAVLVLGANDASRFQPSMATEALSQLGALISPLI